MYHTTLAHFTALYDSARDRTTVYYDPVCNKYFAYYEKDVRGHRSGVGS